MTAGFFKATSDRTSEMGAGASLLKRKKAEVSTADESTNAEAVAKEEGGDGQDNKKNVETVAEKVDDDSVQKDVESEADIKGVDDILCRLTQAHPTPMPNRWGLITKKLNRTMKRKRIPAQPLKALLKKNSAPIPQCWAAEIAEKAKNRELAMEEASLAKKKGMFGGTSTFGGKAKSSDAKAAGDVQAGESDTEPESDPEEEHANARNEVNKKGATTDNDEPLYVYQPLAKHEVFSYMRRLHDRIGANVVETDDATADVAIAMKIIDKLYEELPVGAVKGISQQNLISAGTRQDPLVYGELETVCFLKVLVKLRRIHGHMMEPGGSFWDLGAGVGKLVIAAAMMHNFESCYGVEVLEELRNASRPILNRWRKAEVQKLKAAKADIRLDFMFSDVLKQEGWISEATLLYVHTNFSAIHMRELRKRAGRMKVGSICLSVSLAVVDEDKWGLLAMEKVVTSWGPTKLHIHEKLVA